MTSLLSTCLFLSTLKGAVTVSSELAGANNTKGYGPRFTYFSAMVSKADREILEQVEDDSVRPREETKGDDDTDADVAGDSEVVVEPASGVNATSGRFIRNIASAAATTIGSLFEILLPRLQRPLVR